MSTASVPASRKPASGKPAAAKPAAAKPSKPAANPRRSKAPAVEKSAAAAQEATAKSEETGAAELWKQVPDPHDYPAAISFLRLLMRPASARKTARALRRSKVEMHPVKDILRASALPLLPPDDPAVARDLDKVAAGQQLSPVLLVRGHDSTGLRLVIADGYHRVCASYHLGENEQIPCRITHARFAAGDGPTPR